MKINKDNNLRSATKWKRIITELVSVIYTIIYQVKNTTDYISIIIFDNGFRVQTHQSLVGHIQMLIFI